MHSLGYVCLLLLCMVTALQGAALDITKDPLRALRHMRSIKKDFVKELEQFIPTSDTAFNWSYHLMLARQFEQRNALFLLDECPNDNSDSCLLNRTTCPHYRQAFEESVANKMMRIQPVGNTPLQYVSFGSGGLFQDLMVIHKLLKNRSDVALDVHIMDIEYISCIQMHDALGGDRLILPELKEHPMVSAGAICNDPLTHGTIIQGLCGELMCKQFIQHVKNSFVQAQFSLRVYKDCDDYINYIERHNIPCADIAVAADIGDSYDEAPKAFALLCKIIASKKPDAHNVLLAKNDSNPTIDLVTFHADVGADRKPFYLDDGTCMYRSFEVIPEAKD